MSLNLDHPFRKSFWPWDDKRQGQSGRRAAVVVPGRGDGGKIRRDRCYVLHLYQNVQSGCVDEAG